MWFKKQTLMKGTIAISSTSHFIKQPFHQTAIWSTWHLINLTFHLPSISSNGNFISHFFSLFIYQALHHWLCIIKAFLQPVISSIVLSSTGYFINWLFHRQSFFISHFINQSFIQPIISSTKHFTKWSFHQPVFSSTSHFLDRSFH